MLGKSHLASGDLARARRAFTEAFRLAEPYRLTIVQVIARAHLAEILRREGRSKESEQLAEAALDLAESADLRDHPECAVPHLTLANLLIDAGRRRKLRMRCDGVVTWQTASRTSRGTPSRLRR